MTEVVEISECPFKKSCRLVGDDLGCQLETAVSTFFKNRRLLIREGKADEVLDALFGNSLFQRCPNFFEISSETLDRINDPARFRRKCTQRTS